MTPSGRPREPSRDASSRNAAKSLTQTSKAVRNAGYSDKQVVELVALAAQFLLTNFMNNVADTDIDFPPAPDIP